MTALELARFALYADLGLAFGVPAAAILTGARHGPPVLRPFLVGTAVLGLPLSMIGYLLLVAQMAGTGIGDLDWQLVRDLTINSAVGMAFAVRVVVLCVAVAIGLIARRGQVWWTACAGIALATLAWSGHAAAGEGALALPRLGADIAHLLASSIWLGALVWFLVQLWRRGGTSNDTKAALTRFAGVGSVLVMVLGATGLVNLWFVAPVGVWANLALTDYGKLLVLKLVLFAGMLALAALNRFVLVPMLNSSGSGEDARRGRLGLRLSIGLELCAACAILALVASLGLIDPGSA
ncbi:MAG: copper homeostasis membrane protein CopD [Sphingomonadales bacterium]|nr:copper homeostasis membrane protein CopD [Sphingomonadales bacterium]